MKEGRAVVSILVFFIIAAGCAPMGDQGQPVTRDRGAIRPAVAAMPTIFHVAAGIASQIRANMRGESLQEWPCIVTTLADIDDLQRSSRFGRVLAEAIGSELFKQGGVVRDVRSARSLFVQPQNGELILSRDVEKLAEDVDARAVLAGTYSVGATSVVVNIRMIDFMTGDIISVAMTELARTRTIDSLLLNPEKREQEATPTAYDNQGF